MCTALPVHLATQAEMEEFQRVEAGGGTGPDGKKLSKRPDRVAEKGMKKEGLAITGRTLGHLPGYAMNRV